VNKEPQTFEVAGYSDVDFGVNEAFKVLKQIEADIVRDSPAHAIRVAMTGDLFKIFYTTTVVDLPSRRQQVEEQCHEIFKQTVAMFKKEFKERSGKTLKLTEQKELANSAANKTSLNIRYTYQAWRFYKLGF